MPRTLEIVSLLPDGRISWDAALALQKEAETRVQAGGKETLFLLEHTDVITAGRNADLGEMLVTEDFLQQRGVQLRIADRGGKLTFHGPGQLVAYPVLDLSHGRRDVRRYVSDLEETLIRTARDFGVTAVRSPRPERKASIWVGNDKLGHDARRRPERLDRPGKVLAFHSLRHRRRRRDVPFTGKPGKTSAGVARGRRPFREPLPERLRKGVP
jgi:lipoate-protein ligase B